jgi:hypothetical protein
VSEEQPVILGIPVDIKDPAADNMPLQDIVIVQAPTGSGYHVAVGIVDVNNAKNAFSIVADNKGGDRWEANVKGVATKKTYYNVFANAVLIQNDAIGDTGISVRANCQKT